MKIRKDIEKDLSRIHELYFPNKEEGYVFDTRRGTFYIDCSFPIPHDLWKTLIREHSTIGLFPRVYADAGHHIYALEVISESENWYQLQRLY